MLYKESEVPKSVLDGRKHPSEPYPSPTHAGGELILNKTGFRMYILMKRDIIDVVK